MNYTIIQHPGMLIAGIQTRIQDPETASDITAAFWDSFLAQDITAQLPTAINSDEVAAVHFDYDGAGGYSLLLGSIVESDLFIPQGIKCLTIPAQKYAVFNGVGPLPSIVDNTWAGIAQENIKRIFTYDVELYKDLFCDTKDHSIDFYIAIQ
jgi:predicted transcriptional regulator YdeE